MFGIEPAVRSEVHRAEYRVRGSLNGIDYTDLVRLDRTSLLGEPATFGVLGVRVAFKHTRSQVIGRFKRNNAPPRSYPRASRAQGAISTRPAALLTGLAAASGVIRLVELSHPVVEAGVYDAPAGTALVLANFSDRPIAALIARVPIAEPV